MKIQRLNMDNSWFIEMNGLKLLVDPWLEGKEVDFFPWFNTQWHRTAPISYDEVPVYDYVLITQKYPDHFHKQTLEKLQPKKIIAPASIEKQLKKLLPDAEVISLGKNQRSFSKNNVSIKWYPTARKLDPIYDAFMLSDDVESIFLATHGFFISKEEVKIEKPLKLVISSFNDFQLPFYLGGTISPGIKGLKHLTEKLSPKYIISTHDEDKHAEGLVIKMAKVKRISKSDLEHHSIFKEKILEINHYQPVNI
jgi:hypothetical protein